MDGIILHDYCYPFMWMVREEGGGVGVVIPISTLSHGKTASSLLKLLLSLKDLKIGTQVGS